MGKVNLDVLQNTSPGSLSLKQGDFKRLFLFVCFLRTVANEKTRVACHPHSARGPGVDPDLDIEM